VTAPRRPRPRTDKLLPSPHNPTALIRRAWEDQWRRRDSRTDGREASSPSPSTYAPPRVRAGRTASVGGHQLPDDKIPKLGMCQNTLLAADECVSPAHRVSNTTTAFLGRQQGLRARPARSRVPGRVASERRARTAGAPTGRCPGRTPDHRSLGMSGRAKGSRGVGCIGLVTNLETGNPP
jgi:hypothetical protein